MRELNQTERWQQERSAMKYPEILYVEYGPGDKCYYGYENPARCATLHSTERVATYRLDKLVGIENTSKVVTDSDAPAPAGG